MLVKLTKKKRHCRKFTRESIATNKSDLRAILRELETNFGQKNAIYMASKNVAPKKPLWWTEAKKVEKSPKSPKNHIIQPFEASCHLGSSFVSIRAKSRKIDFSPRLRVQNRGLREDRHKEWRIRPLYAGFRARAIAISTAWEKVHLGDLPTRGPRSKY